MFDISAHSLLHLPAHTASAQLAHTPHSTEHYQTESGYGATTELTVATRCPWQVLTVVTRHKTDTSCLQAKQATTGAGHSRRAHRQHRLAAPQHILYTTNTDTLAHVHAAQRRPASARHDARLAHVIGRPYPIAAERLLRSGLVTRAEAPARRARSHPAARAPRCALSTGSSAAARAAGARCATARASAARPTLEPAPARPQRRCRRRPRAPPWPQVRARRPAGRGAPPARRRRPGEGCPMRGPSRSPRWSCAPAR